MGWELDLWYASSNGDGLHSDWATLVNKMSPRDLLHGHGRRGEHGRHGEYAEKCGTKIKQRKRRKTSSHYQRTMGIGWLQTAMLPVEQVLRTVTKVMDSWQRRWLIDAQPSGGGPMRGTLIFFSLAAMAMTRLLTQTTHMPSYDLSWSCVGSDASSCQAARHVRSNPRR